MAASPTQAAFDDLARKVASLGLLQDRVTDLTTQVSELSKDNGLFRSRIQQLEASDAKWRLEVTRLAQDKGLLSEAMERLEKEKAELQMRLEQLVAMNQGGGLGSSSKALDVSTSPPLFSVPSFAGGADMERLRLENRALKKQVEFWQSQQRPSPSSETSASPLSSPRSSDDRTPATSPEPQRRYEMKRSCSVSAASSLSMTAEPFQVTQADTHRPSPPKMAFAQQAKTKKLEVIKTEMPASTSTSFPADSPEAKPCWDCCRIC